MSARPTGHVTTRAAPVPSQVLNECQEIAYSLLTAAYVCKAGGMHAYVGKYNPDSARGETERNTSSVLCKDAGANSCAVAMENLFITTHANFTQIEQVCMGVVHLTALSQPLLGLSLCPPTRPNDPHLRRIERAQREDQINDALGNAFTNDLMGPIHAVQAQQLQAP